MRMYIACVLSYNKSKGPITKMQTHAVELLWYSKQLSLKTVNL